MSAAGLVVLAAHLHVGARAQTALPTVRNLLERYPAVTPDFSSILRTGHDFERFRERFTKDAELWIRTGDGGGVRRRELAAAALALEVARPSVETDWKQGRRLIEWASSALRKRPAPDEGERLWHLAALTLIQGAYDYELLIKQRDHVWLSRFPKEPRFFLALAVMLESDTWPEPNRAEPWETNEAALFAAFKIAQARRANRSAVTADIRWSAFEHERRAKMRQVVAVLEDLSNSLDIRADALLRLGVLHLRQRHPDVARDQFEDVVRLTSEPFLVYLAHFFTGAAYEQERERAEAIRAYRAALVAMPRAQAASFALASLLFIGEGREEAARIVDTAIALPAADDPWRAYQSGDYRLWPERIAALRQALE